MKTPFASVVILILSFGLITGCEAKKREAAGTQEAAGVRQKADEIANLQDKAEDGDAEAQFKLGTAYSIGNGVTQDDEEAAKWFRKAAEGGDAEAQWALAWRYGSGYQIPKDDVESAKWCRKAAEQGHTTAQYSLGYAYYYGHGLKKDVIEALKWYHKAAERRMPDAQGVLGRAYEIGEGVPKDAVLAYMWLNLAAASGNESAAEDREKVAKEMTSEQIAEAQKMSREWKPEGKR